MRDIKFKGFHPCIDGEEKIFLANEWIKGMWIFGNYVKVEKFNLANEYEYFIIEIDNEGKTYGVFEETVSQYTGLTDSHILGFAYCSCSEVIGNIFSNPELIGGGKE